MNFQECQIEYVFFLLILGLPLYIMLAHFVLMILYFTFALINRCVQSKYLDKLVRKLKFYLFWNGFIRLYMELYQGLCIATVLNLYTAENALESPFLWVRICYYCSIFSLVLIITVPFFIFVPLYFKRRDKWSTDAFQKVYGALLEGTRVDLREKEVKGNWVMLFVPTMFFFRRLVFISSIILLRENILVLILIQTGTIVFNLGIIHTLRTFETRAILKK